MTQPYFLADGSRAVGVTTALGILDKGGLLKWYADRGWLKANADRDAAANFGTRVHSACEAIAKGEDTLLSYPPDVMPFAEAFYGWIEGRRVLYAEFAFVNETHRYGGTLDLCIEMDGSPVLVDLKTSRDAEKPYDTWAVQVAAYTFGLYEATGVLCQRRMVLHLPSNRPGVIKEHWLPDDSMADDFGAFLACLRLYAWRQTYARRPPLIAATPTTKGAALHHA